MLNEQQQLLKSLCEPHYKRKAVLSKGTCTNYIAMQKMLCWLGTQSGIGYKQFEDYTNEDIEKVIPFIENLK